jgi:hypothetical protein
MGRPSGWRDPAVQRTVKPTSLDLAWAAGIYEGEGSCYYGHTEQASVAQKGLWLTSKLQALFGGSVCVCADDLHVWQVYGARARGFLMSIYGLLSPRRQEQIRKALRK